MNKNYYEILGVERSASQEQIKIAYRVAAKKYHPDLASGDKSVAEARFRDCTEAYDVLSDPEKRARYDGTGGPDISDIFGFNPWRSGNFARKGDNKRINITLSLSDILSDIARDVSFSRVSACKACSGSGAAPGKSADQCRTCRGSGKVVNQQVRGPLIMREERVCQTCAGAGTTVKEEDRCLDCKGQKRVLEDWAVNIKIPKGVPSEATLRVVEQGDLGHNGGPRGDLFVVIHIFTHPQFQRIANAADLVAEIPITITKACLGGTVPLTAIDGSSLAITIPPGCQNGQTVKFEGHGLPHFQSNGLGTLFVKFVVKIPTNLTEQQKSLMEMFDVLENGNDEKDDPEQDGRGSVQETDQKGSGNA